MITDVFSLAGTSADEVRWSKEPRLRFAHHRADDIGPRELVRLAELLDVATATSLVGGFSLLAGESQQSPWVVSVPAELVERIADLGDDEIEALASRWRRSDELSTALHPTPLAEYLRGMSRFVRDHDGPFALYIHQER